MPKTDLTNKGVNSNRLTDKQRRFAHEYVIDYNATRAAKAAGYKNPGSSASVLTNRKQNPKVCDYVAQLQREAFDILKITRENVLRELAYLSFRDVKDLCDEDGKIDLDTIGELPERIRRCIDNIKVDKWYDEEGQLHTSHEVKLVPKIRAVELAMKHLGMLAPEELKVTVEPVGWDGMFEEDQNLPDLVNDELNASNMILEEEK